MDPRLYEAARMGDTETLQVLLEEDPLILDRGSLASIPETSLHVAALAGKRNFVKEIMKLKPALARRLNKDGFSPIHLAAANDHAEIVRELLVSDKELGRLQSGQGDGRAAIHCAVITGSVDVLRELITSCPECKSDLTTDRRETALHLAVNNSQVEAFRVLVEMLREINLEEMKELLNAKDHEGNTILHIATFRQQRQIIRLLLVEDNIVDVNAKNNNGLTALDMLDVLQQIASETVDSYIREVLLHAGAVVRSQNIIMPSSSTSIATHQVDENNSTRTMVSLICQPRMFWRFLIKDVFSISTCKFWSALTKDIENSTTETRSAVMVAAVLISTMTFQAVLSPPGGFQQSDGNTNQDEHSNGKAVMASHAVIFLTFSIFNSVGFVSSTAMILMLTRRFPLKILLRLAGFAMLSTYICTLFYISPIDICTTYIATMVMAAIVMIQFIRFTGWFVYRFVKSQRKSAELSRRESPVGV